MRAAKAADERRGELDLTQSQIGVDPTTWRDFVAGRSWPQARTRARIEAKLNWHTGALSRIAAGESTPLKEAIEPADHTEVVPDQVAQIRALANEVDDHYRMSQSRLALTKLRMIRDLIEQLEESHLDAVHREVEILSSPDDLRATPA